MELAGPEEDPDEGSVLEAQVGPGGILAPFILQLSLSPLAYQLLRREELRAFESWGRLPTLLPDGVYGGGVGWGVGRTGTQGLGCSRPPGPCLSPTTPPGPLPPGGILGLRGDPLSVSAAGTLRYRARPAGVSILRAKGCRRALGLLPAFLPVSFVLLRHGLRRPAFCVFFSSHPNAPFLGPLGISS